METSSVGPDKRVACDWANGGGGGHAGASCCAVNNGRELPGGRGWDGACALSKNCPKFQIASWLMTVGALRGLFPVYWRMPQDEIMLW